MGITIRRANENDWQLVRSLRLKALKSDPGVFGSNYEKELAMTESDWRGWFASEDKAIFIVNEHDDAIGITAISVCRDDPSKKTSLLWSSWLEPNKRGRGISRIMYQERINWAKQHPIIEKIIVSHRESNISSKRANQKFGFIYTHRENKVWPDGVSEDQIFYELIVKPFCI